MCIRSMTSAFPEYYGSSYIHNKQIKTSLTGTWNKIDYVLFLVIWFMIIMI